MTAAPGATPFALLLVNYGCQDLLEENFTALDLPALGAELVVVDNHRSARDTAAVTAMAERHGWRLVVLPDNPGFGAAMNAGAEAARAAGCDVLVVLNPDLVLDGATLHALVDGVRAEPDLVLSPRILRPDGRVWFDGAYLSLRRTRTVEGRSGDPAQEPPWLSGACLAVHADLWHRVGGFDPGYFMYWEDVDLSYRLLAAGARLAVRSDLTAVHEVGATQETRGHRAKSPLYYYFNCRNRLLFAARHLPPRERLRWWARTPGYLRDVVLRGGRRQLVDPRRNVWPALRGAGHGSLALLRGGPR